MTVKLQKKLQAHSQESGDKTEATPEAQAVEQTEESARNLAGGIKERTGDGISKVIQRSRQAKAKKRSLRQRQAATADEAATQSAAQPIARERKTADSPRRAEAGQATAQKRMREKAVVDLREKRMEQQREFAAPRMATLPAHTPENGNPPVEHSSSAPDIRERPIHTAKPKEKPAGGAFTPKTRQSIVKVSDRNTLLVPTQSKPMQQAAERAKRRFSQNAQRKMLANQQAAKRAALLSRRAATATVKAIASAVSAIAALLGGTVIISAMILVLMIGAIMASPFGILFSNEPSPNALPLTAAVGQLNVELSNRLELLQTGDYDSITVQGEAPDWREVIAVFAAKTAGGADGVDVAALTPDRIDRLKTVFWDMCLISAETETTDYPDSDTTETNLTITITAKSADKMRTQYAFSNEQNEALTELLSDPATMKLLLTDLAASQEQARELLKNLPDDLTPERRAVVETACTLVGKVTYFWGGKSLVIGWDDRWRQLQRVWAGDNSTTGTYRPFGLDCSGFVDWTFYNATLGAYVIGHGGGATMQHNYCTPIPWSDALPGDLVFYSDDKHIGIVGGRDEDGNLLIIHCASSYNCVVITGLEGFTAIGRPVYYAE